MPQKYPTSCRVFIGNIDNAVVTKSLLRRIFSQYGDIKEDIKIHRGYAFVQYGNERDALAAVQGENYKQLGSKRIEAEIAKGERRSGRSSPKRRDRDRRDRESGDAKRQRMDEMGDYMPAGIQPAMGFGGMPQPSLANVGAMGHMGRPSMAMQGSVQVPIVNVPIYIMSGDVSNYANYVSQMLNNAGINGFIQLIDENMFLELMGQNRYNGSERFTIFIKKKNELEQTIAFRAFNLDGTTPGFADTPIQDVIQYINLNREGQPLLQTGPPPSMQSMMSSGVPQQSLQPDMGGFQQQPQFTPTNLNLQSLQQQLLKFQQQPQQSSQPLGQMSNLPNTQGMLSNLPVSNLHDTQQYPIPTPAVERDSSAHKPDQGKQSRRRSSKRNQQKQQKQTAQIPSATVETSPQTAAKISIPETSIKPTESSSSTTDNILSTISQIQSMISSGVGGAANTAALQSTLSTLLTTLQQQQQQQQQQQAPEEKTSSLSQKSQVHASNGNITTAVPTDNGSESQPDGVVDTSASSTPHAKVASSKPSEGADAVSENAAAAAAGGGDISSILASLQNIIDQKSSFPSRQEVQTDQNNQQAEE